VQLFRFVVASFCPSPHACTDQVASLLQAIRGQLRPRSGKSLEAPSNGSGGLASGTGAPRSASDGVGSTARASWRAWTKPSGPSDARVLALVGQLDAPKLLSSVRYFERIAGDLASSAAFGQASVAASPATVRCLSCQALCQPVDAVWCRALETACRDVRLVCEAEAGAVRAAAEAPALSSSKKRKRRGT
jgi:hypothetical protein